MTTQLKRVISILLIAILIVGMVGCGKKPKADNEWKSGNSTQSAKGSTKSKKTTGNFDEVKGSHDFDNTLGVDLTNPKLTELEIGKEYESIGFKPTGTGSYGEFNLSTHEGKIEIDMDRLLDAKSDEISKYNIPTLSGRGFKLKSLENIKFLSFPCFDPKSSYGFVAGHISWEFRSKFSNSIEEKSSVTMDLTETNININNFTIPKDPERTKANPYKGYLVEFENGVKGIYTIYEMSKDKNDEQPTSYLLEVVTPLGIMYSNVRIDKADGLLDETEALNELVFLINITNKQFTEVSEPWGTKNFAFKFPSKGKVVDLHDLNPGQFRLFTHIEREYPDVAIESVDIDLSDIGDFSKNLGYKVYSASLSTREAFQSGDIDFRLSIPDLDKDEEEKITHGYIKEG